MNELNEDATLLFKNKKIYYILRSLCSHCSTSDEFCVNKQRCACLCNTPAQPPLYSIRVIMNAAYTCVFSFTKPTEYFDFSLISVLFSVLLLENSNIIMRVLNPYLSRDFSAVLFRVF